jgi:phosphoribosyl-ATP pyrophosphohydrolase
MSQNQLTLDALFEVVKSKINDQEEGSYSFELFKKGVEKITRKIGEEALEVIIATFIHKQKNEQKTREELVGEVCDLFYHTLVLLASQQIEFSEILVELNKRNHKK